MMGRASGWLGCCHLLVMPCLKIKVLTPREGEGPGLQNCRKAGAVAITPELQPSGAQQLSRCLVSSAQVQALEGAAEPEP